MKSAGKMCMAAALALAIASSAARAAGKSVLDAKSPNGARTASLICSNIGKVGADADYSQANCKLEIKTAKSKTTIVVESELSPKKENPVFGDGIELKDVKKRIRWSADNRYLVYVHYTGSTEYGPSGHVIVRIFDTKTGKSAKYDPGADLIGHAKYANNPRCVVPYGGIEILRTGGVVFYTIKEFLAPGEYKENACENSSYKINRITINLSGREIKKEVLKEKGFSWG